jgi:hypothetical protein
MQIGNLPTTQECYTRIGVGLWVVLRETNFSMQGANTVDSLDDPLYVAVASEVDWIVSEGLWRLTDENY